MTRAIVLVGGFGTRLRPLTNSTPKQMLPIVNRPMIEHVLEHLEAHGITEAVLSLGFRPDAFREAYPGSRHGGVDLAYAIEPEPLDTAGAIRFAARHAGIDEPVVVCNGDVITDLDVSDLIARHEAAGAAATIALHRVADPSAFGVVPTDPDGRVQAFVEKPERGTEPTDAINAGTYVLEPSVIDRIADVGRVSIERVTFPSLVETGELYAFVSNTYWIDTGTPANYLQVQLDLLDGVRGEAVPGVHDRSMVSPDAQVKRSVIGEGVAVGAGASVADSVVMAGATIGDGAVVDTSIVGPGARIGAGAEVTGLSVIGLEVDVAAGETLDGARRPEPE
ncbi:MAG TPA: NDP-sugar synthase [Acidimicrobiales bacterium]|nr:NDP-sugar synthase [Acidimicrobiales bacterium]